MFNLFVILTVICASEAVPGFAARDFMNDVLVPAAFQTESRVCSDRCLAVIGGERHLLNLNEIFVDSENPCERFMCKIEGLVRDEVNCASVEDPCPDGNPPFTVPGQCCPTCGGGPREPDEFDEWGEWTECSKTCGNGARARMRECKISENRVLVDCRGETLEVENCNLLACPVHCRWVYSDYGECSVTCGKGVHQRFPIITQNASNGGADCPPFVRQHVPDEEDCYTNVDCPVCPAGKNLCLLKTHPNYKKCIEDIDEDCVPNDLDNCINTTNTDQEDMDSDGVGDRCDNCINAKNPLQENADYDVTGDACDPDDDNDGIIDTSDNCQTKPNRNQSDIDSDLIGDACDNCRNTPNANQADYDRDDVGNACDNCRFWFNPKQEEDAEIIYGVDKCKIRPAMSNSKDAIHSGSKGFVAEIMEKLLELYYAN